MPDELIELINKYANENEIYPFRKENFVKSIEQMQWKYIRLKRIDEGINAFQKSCDYLKTISGDSWRINQMMDALRCALNNLNSIKSGSAVRLLRLMKNNPNHPLLSNVNKKTLRFLKELAKYI